MRKLLLSLFALPFIFFSFIGISKSQNWTTLTSGTTETLWSVNFPTPDTGYAVGANGTVLRTFDGGNNWTVLTPPAVGTFYTVKFIDQNTGFIMGASGRIFKTTDAGTTWVQKTSGATSSIWTSDILPDGMTIYAAGGGSGVGLLLKSTDAGETWSSLTPPANVVFRGIQFDDSNPQIGYLAGEALAGVSNSMYKTTDGGASWSLLTTPYANPGDLNNFFGISVIDQNNVFVVGGNKRIAKTTDGGSTWTKLDNATANYYRGTYFTTPNKGYVVGANGKILYTNNGGSSFTSQTTGTTQILNSVFVNQCGTAYSVGEFGVILRKKPTITGTNDSYSTSQDLVLNTNATQGVLNNDIHQEGAALIATLVTSPTNGTITLNSDGSFIYTPNAGYFGTDQFTYSLQDVCGNTSAQNTTVSITISQSTSSSFETYSNNSVAQIYPSIVENMLTLKIFDNELTKIEILSLDGRVIFSKNGPVNDQLINFNEFAPGFYQVLLFKNQTLAFREKVINQ